MDNMQRASVALTKRLQSRNVVLVVLPTLCQCWVFAWGICIVSDWETVGAMGSSARPTCLQTSEAAFETALRRWQKNHADGECKKVIEKWEHCVCYLGVLAHKQNTVELPKMLMLKLKELNEFPCFDNFLKLLSKWALVGAEEHKVLFLAMRQFFGEKWWRNGNPFFLEQSFLLWGMTQVGGIRLPVSRTCFMIIVKTSRFGSQCRKLTIALLP